MFWTAGIITKNISEAYTGGGITGVMPTFGRIAYYLNIDLGKREKDPIIQSQQANQTLEVSGKKLEKELYNVCCLKYWLWQGHCGYKTKHLFSRGLKRSFSWKGLWCLCVIPSYDSESRMYSDGISFEKLMNLHVDHHQLYVLLQVKHLFRFEIPSK